MKSRVWKYLEKEILVNKKTEQSEIEILEAKFEKQQMEKVSVYEGQGVKNEGQWVIYDG